MILIYTTCKDKREAAAIARAVLSKRLAACAVILPGATSFYFWPPHKNRIVRSSEAILLVKTLRKKSVFAKREICSLHSYKTPMILEFSPARVSKEYLRWINEEMS